jgi:hypothetical protein
VISASICVKSFDSCRLRARRSSSLLCVPHCRHRNTAEAVAASIWPPQVGQCPSSSGCAGITWEGAHCRAASGGASAVWIDGSITASTVRSRRCTSDTPPQCEQVTLASCSRSAKGAPQSGHCALRLCASVFMKHAYETKSERICSMLSESFGVRFASFA